MLVAGNVIIGRKVEETKESVEEDHDVPLAGPSTNTESYGAVPLAGGVLPVEKDDDEDVALLGDLDDARS